MLGGPGLARIDASTLIIILVQPSWQNASPPNLIANMTKDTPRRKITTLGLTLSVALLTVMVPSTALAQKKKAAPKKPAKIRLPASVLTKEKVKMNVAPVAKSRRSAIKAAATQLDSYVEQQLINNNVTPNAIASDQTFLRRVYLDIGGRIPSLTEATEFLKSTNPQKREDLIDELLSSPDYVSNMYNFWADTLRPVSYTHLTLPTIYSV